VKPVRNAELLPFLIRTKKATHLGNGIKATPPRPGVVDDTELEAALTGHTKANLRQVEGIARQPEPSLPFHGRRGLSWPSPHLPVKADWSV
jgi:hypothetical protein